MGSGRGARGALGVYFQKVAANGSGGWVSEKYWEAEWMDGPDE